MKKIEDTVIDAIKSIAQKDKLSIIDATIAYAEKNNIEIETIADLLRRSSLKSELLKNAQSLNMVRAK